MLRVAGSDNASKLAHVADARPEAPLEAIAKPFAGVAGASEVYRDALLGETFSVLSRLLVLEVLSKEGVPRSQSEGKL